MRFSEWIKQFESQLLKIISLCENWDEYDDDDEDYRIRCETTEDLKWNYDDEYEDDEDYCIRCGTTEDLKWNYDEDGYVCQDCSYKGMTRGKALETRKFAFDHFFPSGEDRIYLPFDAHGKEGGNKLSDDDKDVIEAVKEFKGGGKYPESEDGYEVVDYVKGLAAPKTITKKDQFSTPEEFRTYLKAKGVSDSKIQRSVAAKFGLSEGERPLFKIKGILETMLQQEIQKTKNDLESDKISQRKYNKKIIQLNKWHNEWIYQFENSIARHGKGMETKYMVVISKDARDIENMSTGRSWTSCMDLNKGDGDRENDIYCEIQGGGFIAYLTTPEDKYLNDPKARILIRRFDSKDGKSVAIPEDSVYGWEAPGFVNFVKKWIETKQGKITPGLYDRKGGEYSDTFSDDKFIAPENKEDLWKLIDNWTQNEDDENAVSNGKEAVAEFINIDRDNPLSDEEAKKLFPFIKMIGGVYISTFIRNHPNLETDERLRNINASDLKNMLPKLSPSRQKAIKKQVYDYLMKNLEYPSPLMSPDNKEQAFVSSEYRIINLFNNMIDQTQIFNPIPKPLVKKMEELAKVLATTTPLTKATKTRAGGGFSQNWQDNEQENRIINNIAHVLSITKTDTPEALDFFRHHLNQQGEKGFDFSNVHGYNSWFSAVGGLGSKGREFLPQLQSEFQKNSQMLQQYWQELDQINPTDADYISKLNRKHELESLISRLQQAQEEYGWAIDAISSGTGRSDKYDPW